MVFSSMGKVREKLLTFFLQMKRGKMVKIGIIGGSGLERPEFLQESRAYNVYTRFGRPSSSLVCGKIQGAEVVLLSRHGRDHNLMPTNVPYRANIHALKRIGCTHVIATTACGSLREDIRQGDFVLLDQFIDRTTRRVQTFYGQGAGSSGHGAQSSGPGKVAHIPMAEPFCKDLRSLLYAEAKRQKLRTHERGTAITIEGPRFSSRAESNLFRQWRADVINMTTVPEVVLAREAGLHYAAIAIATDYDCWRHTDARGSELGAGGESVSVELVLQNFKKSVEKVKALILGTIPIVQNHSDACAENIKKAFL